MKKLSTQWHAPHCSSNTPHPPRVGTSQPTIVRCPWQLIIWQRDPSKIVPSFCASMRRVHGDTIGGHIDLRAGLLIVLDFALGFSVGEIFCFLRAAQQFLDNSGPRRFMGVTSRFGLSDMLTIKLFDLDFPPIRTCIPGFREKRTLTRYRARIL